jgi:anti-sigma factor RsiW
MTDQKKPGLKRRLKGFVLKHMHRMITCKEFEGFVLNYLDGDLPVSQQTIFELHLKICRECREYLAAYQRSIELGRAVFDAPDEPVPQDVPEDLVRAILDARDR